MIPDAGLKEENERLREENARLRLVLDELRQKLTEPEEVIRAIRHGEVDALVVQEEGREAIYSLQRFDLVYRAVVEECLPYGVWLAEVDGRLLYVTPSFLELLRVDLGEMQRRGQFHFLPPEVREGVEQEWARCRQTGDAYNAEYRIRIGSAERVIWTHGILARTQDGLSRWVGVNIDVTEREAIKDELRQQAAALTAADRRKDEFLALLGHELRNPLAAIQNGLHVLAMSELHHASFKRAQAMMKRQLNHLTRLVDDLLDVSRITRGTIQLRKETVELTRAVEQSVESVRPLLEAERHALTLSLPPPPVLLEADPIRLEQILVNLLNNAAKYTRKGGSIAVHAELEGREVVIRVRDNGIGISADVLPEIFGLFVQAERTLDRSQGGLGIGLSLVKKLVELHGGSIAAQSAGPDQGSEFTVRLAALARGDGSR